MDYANMEEARAQAEQHRQQLISQKHEIRRLFTELKQEHLVTLIDMLAIIISSDEEAARVNAAHFYAFAQVHMETRFKICSACGLNHDEAIEELAPQADAAMRLPFPRHHEEAFQLSESQTEPKTDLDPLQVGQAGVLNQKQQDDMREYNLDDLRAKGTNVLLGFICMGCGLNYTSIEDRMLKAKDDCHGCHLKAAHG